MTKKNVVLEGYSEEELKDPTFLREQVRQIREETQIDVFFKDLIKIRSRLARTIDGKPQSLRPSLLSTIQYIYGYNPRGDDRSGR